MKCTVKEQETCNVEKRGCDGCAYNGSDKNVGSIEKLIEELTKVRPHELSKDEKAKHFKVHRLVAEAFIKKPELQVNHIDGNKRVKGEVR